MTISAQRYNLIEKGRDDQARRDLTKLRGTDEIEDELQELEKEALQDTNQDVMSFIDIFRDRSLRWQIIVVSVGQIGQQLGGFCHFVLILFLFF